MLFLLFFFFNDTATTEIYTLSLHDALPILIDHELGGDEGVDLRRVAAHLSHRVAHRGQVDDRGDPGEVLHQRSEEHTSELQSRQYLVCRLLLEKKKSIVSTSAQV